MVGLTADCNWHDAPLSRLIPRTPARKLYKLMRPILPRPRLARPALVWPRNRRGTIPQPRAHPGLPARPHADTC
jgi:hypothetical protein